MDSNTIIIVLLLILISLYIWDIMNREGFFPYDDNIFANVNYNTPIQNCGSLAGPSPCAVRTVRPRRKEICNKKLDFESPDKRIGNPTMNARQNVKYNQKEVDFGMSLDDLDDIDEIGGEVGSEVKLDLNDDVMYQQDRKRETDNKKIIENIIKYDNGSISNEGNTLSDVDEQLLSLN